MRTVLTRAVIGVALAIAIAALGGCSGAAPSGGSWKLVGWSLSSLEPEPFAITMVLADGKISGHGGVNTYGGSYREGSDGSFSTSEIAQTEMAGGADAMRAESAYMTLLGSAKWYTITGDTLTLYDANHNEELIFARTAK
jgi:heat shock protein HslJ